MRRATVFLSVLLLVSSRLAAQQSDSVHANGPARFNSALELNTETSPSVDTLGPNFAHYKYSLDSMKHGLTHRIDSLERLKLPTAQYKRKLDSLNQIDPLKVVKQQEAKLNVAEQKVTGTINSAEKKLNQELNSLTKGAEGGVSVPNTNLPNANIPGANLNVPQLNNSLSLPNNSIPQLTNPINGNVDGLGNIQKDMNSFSNLPQKEMSEVKNLGDVSGAEKDIGEASQLTKKAAGYEKQISGVAKGDSASIAQLSKTAENDAKNLGGVKDLTKQTQVLDNYKNIAGQAGNPQALEKDVMSQAPQQAINHFAGKEQVLTNAMSQISKIKQKYSKVTSLSDLPKRPPNPMHGKPLIERIVPGFTFVIVKINNTAMLDFNPWVGYRFNGHLTAGAGWNDRVQISHYKFSTQHFYGPRVFGEFKLRKGFSLRGEVETMNTFIPPNQVAPKADPSSRKWVWTTFAGLKREYKLFKYLKGNIFILYNVSSLFTQHRINLYGDPLTVRMGFEFPMKKKGSR